MLNKEKFKNEIVEIACKGERLALKNGNLTACASTCGECDFYPSCKEKCREWANSEYVEPPVDWSKVPVDTPILVRDVKVDEWQKRHFSSYENGMVHTWTSGRTSWTEDSARAWNFAKLAESEEANVR